jgi:hypothetical protein
VYGSSVHADFRVQAVTPKGKWNWPSYHSLVWREDVKSRISALVDELKRQGLSRKIVGVHLAGYHDAQFATRHPDFSKPAVAAFVEWQKRLYGKVRWTEAPVYDKKPMFDRATDEHHIAYLKFVKQGPFHMQEDLARHIRKCFGKDIVIGLQVDMNGNFVSLHALRNGRYSFRLPRKCKVVNMKTGKTVKNGTLLELDMTAGETRWYQLLD